MHPSVLKFNKMQSKDIRTIDERRVPTLDKFVEEEGSGTGTGSDKYY